MTTTALLLSWTQGSRTVSEQAEAKLLELVRDKVGLYFYLSDVSLICITFQVAEGPLLRNSIGPEVQKKPVEGLAAAFQHLMDRSQPTLGQEDVEEQV